MTTKCLISDDRCHALHYVYHKSFDFSSVMSNLILPNQVDYNNKPIALPEHAFVFLSLMSWCFEKKMFKYMFRQHKEGRWQFDGDDLKLHLKT